MANIFDLFANSIHPILSLDGVLTAFSNKSVRITNTRPELGEIGDIWYDPETNLRYIYTAGGWVLDTEGNTATGGTTHTGTTEPITKHVGDYWYDTTTGILYQWTGSEWVAVGGVLVRASKTLKANYSQLTPLSNKVIKLPYENAPILTAPLVIPYSQLDALFSIVTFPYSNQPVGFNFNGIFSYSIASNRLRFPLLKSFLSYYSLGNPVPVTNSISLNYGDMSKITTTTTFGYADSAKITTTTTFAYADSEKLVVSLKLPYAPKAVLTKTLVTPFGNTVKIATVLAGGWVSTAPVTLSTSFNYEISAKQYVFIEGKFGYSIQNLNVQSIQATPTLYKNGEVIDFIVINLSADESSPYWIGSVSVANIEDFSKFNVEDAIQIVFNDQTFNMIIDGKNLSRGDNATQACQLSMVSPTALLDTPFASTLSKSYEHSTSAREVVEEMVGSVSWDLPDWLVPVEQLQFSNTTPMQVARNIVAAVGGVLETTPEGAIVCRKTYATNIPDYPSIEGYPLSDSDLFSVREDIAPQKIINKVDLYTSELGSIKDTLEYVSNEGTSTSGVIHAYPSPYRSIGLIHTGAPTVVINPVGDSTRTETETVEFLAGKASTRYPIDSIKSMQWHYTNLGAVSYSNNSLNSTILGESLLVLSYSTRSYQFNVAGADTTQFVTTD